MDRRRDRAGGRRPARGTGKFQAILREEDQQQTVIGVSDGPPLESADRYAAQLLTTVLGDHTGSRLYWALVDPGHADGAELSYQDYNQAGALFSFLSCAPEETQANLERITAVYQEVLKEGISDDELTKAKNKVLSRSVLRSERPMGRLGSLGFLWTYRREYQSLADELDAFGKVSLADIRRVLDQWPLLPMTIVSVGPTVDVKAPV